jgi:hypothetical protein
MDKREKQEIIETISTSRREFVRKATKAGFIVPVVATFTMTGLMSAPAAAVSNGS